MKPIKLASRHWKASVFASVLASVLLSLVAAHAIAQAETPATERAEFDAALAEYERNHWAKAYAVFARLADRGHPEAIRMAWEMHRLGPALYGQRFDATPYQHLVWRWHYRCGSDCRAPAESAIAASGC